MEKCHFPGYGRCIACEDLIPEKDFHNHNLNCRLKSSNEKKLCQFCNKHIDAKQLQQHVATCNQQRNISSNTTLSSKKQCSICKKFVEDLALHYEICDNDENNSTGYQTPRAQTPTQIDTNSSTETINSNKKQQTKFCSFCSQQIDESVYGNHIQSCSNNHQNEDHQTNRTNNNLNDKKTSSIDENLSEKLTNLKTKRTKYCILCSQQIDESIYGDHIQSCSNNDHYQDDNRKLYEKKIISQIDKKPSKEENILKKKQRKFCSLCSEEIDQSEYLDHIEHCSNDHKSSSFQPLKNSDSTNDTQNSKQNSSSYTSQTNTNSYNKSIISKKKEKKICGLCSQQIDELEYQNHLQSCSNHHTSSSHQKYTNNPTYNDTTTSRQSSIEVQKQTNSKIKQTKLCSFCSQQIDESIYEDHIQSCSNDNRKSFNKKTSSIDENLSEKLTNLKIKRTKYCILCSQQIDESIYGDHIQSCSNNDHYQDDNRKLYEKKIISQIDKKASEEENIMKRKQMKFCSLCSEEIDQSEYLNHVEYCSNNGQSSMKMDIDKDDSSKILSKKTKEKKSCPSCLKSLDEEEYVEHISLCSSKKKNREKDCIICFKPIDESEYIDHVQSCSSQISPSISSSQNNKNDYQTDLFHQPTTSNRFSSDDEQKCGTASGGGNVKKMRDCIMCFKPIDLSQYEDHVAACIAATENQPYNSTTKKSLKCLTCNRSLNKDDYYHEMSCHSRHNHCLTCLKRSMEEFARNREAPVCHKTLCDYELSRHDISSIPLERRLSDRLLKVVKGQQRPLCTKCHFYIDVNENVNFDEHFELCGELIPCEYCQFPFPFTQLEIHARQCRNDNISQNEKLINFILPRTKYPFTKEQIRIFIQQQSKNRRNQLDPSSIIDALAVFGPTFPYDIPTRECGVCMEARPYDDIYVFDCPDSHKLCYTCYYQSCQAKMDAGEILTCALCTTQLRDGELNQLRIPIDQLKKIRDYQMKKTFDVYSSRTRGIIKCPSQDCTWVAEAADPNERFKVQCPQCHREFCSLCNQQYHYRTNCQQLPQITQRWFFWCNTERTRYLTMRAQQDTAYANQLADYNRQTNENDDRNKDLRRRYEELMNDEQYKSQNCRLCPSCKRVVQRLEGCDSMICGQDAHGGNVQSGCGAKFNWAQAQTYTAAATQQPKQTIIDLPKPDNPVVHHDGVKCDQCQNDVNGIRFDCVHCPALTFCEKCEQESTLIHSRENQAFQQQQHVFKLIMVPQEEAIQL